MRKKRGYIFNWKASNFIVFGIAIGIVIGCLAFLLLFSAGDRKKVCREGAENQNPVQASFVTAQELFGILSASRGQTEKKNFEGTAVAGVVPHHLVAGSLIGDFLEALAVQEPELLILVGPNHYNRGGRIITGFADWQTPAGLVKTDGEIVQALLDQKEAAQDEQVLGQEHSVGSLMPLLKQFIPEAKVVPLIFHHNVSLAEVERLLDFLAPLLAGKKAVVLASVDFSHYLTRTQAREKDEYTLRVMSNFDYVTLFRLGNDYLDSPASLAMAFRYAERKGMKKFQLLANTNAGEILQNDEIETTSYFTLVFTKKF